MNCTLQIVLFGSHAAGTARPDSDFDVLLVGEELARHVVPQPLPHDEPGFYDPTTAVRDHHRRKRDWSGELWNRLGGDAAVLDFRQRALNYLTSLGHDVRDEKLDLFLYLPKSVSITVWAVELAWEVAHARLDFACAASQSLWTEYPGLRASQDRILSSRESPGRKAIALEEAIWEMTGNDVGDEYRQLRSLSELRRDVPRYRDAVNQTGLD